MGLKIGMVMCFHMGVVCVEPEFGKKSVTGPKNRKNWCVHYIRRPFFNGNRITQEWLATAQRFFFVVGVSIVGLNLRKSFFSYLERFRRKLHICAKSDSDICWPLIEILLFLQ